MKTRDILTALFIVVLAFSGCREIAVTTKIHPDGSFTRSIRVTGDSSSVFRGDLPYPVDSSWTRVAIKDSAGDPAHGDDYILTYSKTFKNSDDLMAEINLDTGWMKQLDRKISVTKRFGFFYSFLTFREVFQPANPFTILRYQDFLTDEDIQWLSGQKSVINPSDSSRFDEAEEKAEQYFTASVTFELEQLLEAGVTRLHDPSLKTSDISRFHDSISRYVENWEFNQPENFIHKLRTWTGNPAVERLLSLEPPLFEDFQKKADFLDTLIMMETYPETVEMPGLITETNSVMLKGNQVSWEIQPLNFLFKEYELVVESRVVNNWAFVITGILLVLLIVVLIVKAVKK